jgi:hypothetical protein
MTKTWIKEASRMFAHGLSGEGRHFLLATAIFIAVACGGCATHKSDDSAPEPGSGGVVEYKEITAEALSSIRAALDSLEKVNAQPYPCPTNVSAEFTDRVLQLQSDSLRVRARAQAILSRGDAYFASWSESIARIKDPQIRNAAERYRPQLQESFTNIKLASQKAGASFKPFLSGLRMLHVQLEKDNGLPQNEATKELVRTTRANGDEAVKELDTVNGELDAITRMLTSEKSRQSL